MFCVLEPRNRQWILDDLAEEYRETILPALGPRGARRWYWRQLGGSVMPGLRLRLRCLTARSRPAVRKRTRRWAARGDRTWSELRSVVRRLRRSPGFTVTGSATVALAVGASVVVFSLVDAVLIRPLPYPDAERLVSIQHAAPGIDQPGDGISAAAYFVYGDAEAVERLGVLTEARVNLTGQGDPERIEVALASHDLFATLGIPALHGRVFQPADAHRGDRLTVLEHGTWKRRYGGDPEMVGQRITINGREWTVVSVMPPGFGFPRPSTQAWLHVTPERAEAGIRDFYHVAVARLRPGFSAPDAASELARLRPAFAEGWADASPRWLEQAGLTAVVQPLKERVVGDVTLPLWLLFGAVVLLLLVASANVTNLFLVRAEQRRGELALHLALGAGRGAVLRHFVLEGLALAALGGLLGLLAGAAAVDMLLASAPLEIPRLHEVAVDGRSFLFVALLTLVAGATFGCVPIWCHRRLDVRAALKGGGGTGVDAPSRQGPVRVLVGAQVAVALTLVVGSLLMVRSLQRLMQVDRGFDGEGVSTMFITLPFGRYPAFDDARRFFDRVLQDVRALPGVEAAGACTDLPLSPIVWGEDLLPLDVEGRPTDAAEPAGRARLQQYFPGYLEALRIQQAGHRFAGGEPASTSRPVLVSASLARRLFGESSPLGRRVRLAARAEAVDSDPPWNTVVGVVGDVRDASLAGAPSPILYVPVLDRPVVEGWIPRGMYLVVRASVDPGSLPPAIRRIVGAVDPDVPISDVATMTALVAADTARRRFTMTLLAIAAATALFLGTVGLYGVVSCSVGRRRHEIGVRMALGARSSEVGRMIVGEALEVTLVGLAAGTVAALWLTRFLGALLYDVAPSDPLAFAATAGLLLAVSVLASWLPARRAARIDPSRALRSE
jgi:predicted permease